MNNQQPNTSLSRRPDESASQYASRMTTQGAYTRYAIELMQDGYSAEEAQKIIDEAQMSFPSLLEVMNELLAKKKTSVADAAAWSDTDTATLYRVMKGSRNPSRNLILRVAINLELSLDETQTLLKSCKLAQLSGTRPRDNIIMHGIINREKTDGYIIDEINKELAAKNMLTLEGRG